MLRAAFGREDGQRRGTPCSPADVDAVAQHAARRNGGELSDPAISPAFARRSRQAGSAPRRQGMAAASGSASRPSPHRWSLLVSGVAAGFPGGPEPPGRGYGRRDAGCDRRTGTTQRPGARRGRWSSFAERSDQHLAGRRRQPAGGSITPTVTYVAEDGAFCREVETEADILGRSAHRRRHRLPRGDGQWRVRILGGGRPGASGRPRPLILRPPAVGRRPGPATAPAKLAAGTARPRPSMDRAARTGWRARCRYAGRRCPLPPLIVRGLRGAWIRLGAAQNQQRRAAVPDTASHPCTTSPPVSDSRSTGQPRSIDSMCGSILAVAGLHQAAFGGGGGQGIAVHRQQW